MHFSRNAFCGLLLFLVATVCNAEPQVDKEYRVIPQQPTPSGKKIEVIEFFFYGCPYCNQLQPFLDEWRKHMPDNVVFIRKPAVHKESWIPLTKTYFALEAMGELENLHSAVFYSYHVDDLHLSEQSVMFDWAAKHGLDAKKFSEIYISRETAAKIEQAKKTTKDYEISGTPSLVVDGKYLTSSGMVEEVKDLVPILDYLIKLARKDRVQ